MAMAALGRVTVARPVQQMETAASLPGRSSVSDVSMRKFSSRGRCTVQTRWPSEPRPGSAQACLGRDSADGDALVAEFIRHVESTQQAWPLEGRRPTHLMPPSTVVKTLMEALMRNDWPEDDSGIRTAFAFAMPPAANEMLVSDVGKANRSARAWYATEKYVNVSEFGDVIRESTYSPMLDFVSWEMGSPLTFHGPSDKRAVQAVKTISQSGVSSVYTFCLEKVVNGVYKGCWMIVGVRVGDYANV
ncbi:hypothetical protein MPTK1_5g21010 [Marchantia polymorpha subsp. ruderalis]|uniref:Uncharacterized protein n=2 Tax=Marchantia polymorpha TaxID=3197 RepID=A0AAF6BKL4_MARPO|nr:hypothetical protein MARPO_0058s0082 [Marchantia polymorpha]BBN12548.1 hypothetical protein Mp_5g21010 [Marchantia polymorpha subsp. ruderalis]|eukprot:PTQ37306.1 hypothetical protein MARPO_0058s0082 [Marchantia polymorpha]